MIYNISDGIKMSKNRNSIPHTQPEVGKTFFNDDDMIYDIFIGQDGVVAGALVSQLIGTAFNPPMSVAYLEASLSKRPEEFMIII